MTEVLR
jgi:hypothetical protein